MTTVYKVVRPISHGKVHVINDWPRHRGETLCGRRYDTSSCSEFDAALDGVTCGTCRSNASAYVTTVERARALYPPVKGAE